MNIFTGTYTVLRQDGQHRTFKVSQAEDKTTFFSVLNGPDNERNYDCVAFQKPGYNAFRLTRRHANLDKAGITFKALSYLTNATPEQAKACGIRWAKASGNCFVCGRKLTTPESIEAGIGPVCADRW